MGSLAPDDLLPGGFRVKDGGKGDGDRAIGWVKKRLAD